jgi:preprotein translocase subunit Sss1
MTDLSGSVRTRPPAIERAVMLLWVAVAIGVVSSLLSLTMLGASFSGLLATIIGLAITAFLIIKVGEGRNWARIVLLVLFAIGLVGFVVAGGLSFGVAPFLTLIGLVQLGIEGYALYLIFTPPGSDWFKVG